ncbi:hypothetical protein E3N88_28395 [Mikania micrantha]|uniref:PGG domain-containing protein n=1 Tax=Mikania micrantha TaxID=192012 RepID=A0A5N6N0Y3_9ASTR|nr:hypothetical protein E3N88_28395 [Mikania micrantha]
MVNKRSLNKSSILTKAGAELWHHDAFFDWDRSDLHCILNSGNVREDIIKPTINIYGDTILHIAVGTFRNDLLNTISRHINDDDWTEIKNLNGSTVLHIAAIAGNSNAAELLLKLNKKLLHIKDKEGKKPLEKAYENVHLDTTFILLSASDGDEDILTGINFLAQVILVKQYDMAKEIINKKSEYAVSNDKVLMAIAGAFPSGLDYMEAFFCPSLEYICEKILNRTSFFFDILATLSSNLKVEMISTYLSCLTKCEDLLQGICILFILVPGLTILWMFYLIILLLLMAYLPFFMSYCLLWKVAAIFVPGIKNIELKKKEYEDAKKVLELVCQKIKDRHPDDCSSYELKELYSSPILLAACQDAYDVVDEILCRWPEAILCKDKNGYDIIQLATIYRSKKIYNLIYTLRMHNSTVYGNLEDFFKNNMLHLAGKLAPLNKLKLHTGAALQLQSELQWHQEVKKLVFPTFVTKENIFMETPEMMFTREHEYLVKEGEKWIKAVAESCSITAALIITIVFAAAITVPGGSSQNGVPVFTNETAFLIFALSDAISLFSSVTALLVFLSILTTRFAEKDYLVRLPIRLIIGLCTLLVSTTAMIVAFSATLFLVFCHQKLWMIAPICQGQTSYGRSRLVVICFGQDKPEPIMSY